jgi:hypothetical protein
MATNKGGRPRKQIDKEQFEKLCNLQCTLEEMCCYFDCDDKTLEKWCKRTYKKGFSDIFRIKRGNGKISLRRKQFEVALSGNPTMLIWLGRNMLGQTDKIEISGNIAASIDPFAGLTTEELRKLAEDE